MINRDTFGLIDIRAIRTLVNTSNGLSALFRSLVNKDNNHADNCNQCKVSHHDAPVPLAMKTFVSVLVALIKSEINDPTASREGNFEPANLRPRPKGVQTC